MNERVGKIRTDLEMTENTLEVDVVLYIDRSIEPNVTQFQDSFICKEKTKIDLLYGEYTTNTSQKCTTKLKLPLVIFTNCDLLDLG